MYRISKQFHFCASHILENLPPDHPCSRMHGHNYVVELELASEDLDAAGFIVDYNDLSPFEDLLKEEFDHRHLNDVVDFNPSAELLAAYFHRRARSMWPQVSKVRLSETPKTWAEFTG